MSHSKLIHLIHCLAMLFAISSAVEINIKTKSDWKGAAPSNELAPLTLPVGKIIISHSASHDCNDVETCAHILRNIQSFQMKSGHFDDISYNFLIGNDGNVYEGRGWDKVGAHTIGHNADSLGICFIGTYLTSEPTSAALDAAKSLLEFGVQSGKITEDYKLYGARQFKATESPGKALYDIIKQWPHWSQA